MLRKLKFRFTQRNFGSKEEMKNENDISAEDKAEKKRTWFSEENENKER